MKSLSNLTLTLALAAGAFVYACSSSEEDLGGGGSGSTSGAGSTDGKGSSGANNGNGGDVSLGTSTSLGGSSGSLGGATGTSTECGATDVEAELAPIYMIFIYDSSGSMGLNKGIDNTAVRWAPVTAGLTDFFKNANAPNVKASIAFFPFPAGPEATCAHDYSVPDISLTSLDNPQHLLDKLAEKVPQGGTPTLPALYGGIKMAKGLLAKEPRSKAMVVLVTDGEPDVCNTDGQCGLPCAPEGVSYTNTIESIETLAYNTAQGTPPVPIHVIGIGTGQAIEGLNQIAIAGGTEQMLQVKLDGAPADTTAAIVKKLTDIQTREISCDIAVPATNENWDKTRVNVHFVRTDGTVDALKRSDGCSGPGWRYDDPEDPQYIQLCESTCKNIQGDLGGKIKVLLGCQTDIF